MRGAAKMKLMCMGMSMTSQMVSVVMVVIGRVMMVPLLLRLLTTTVPVGVPILEG